ncbi:hypothetical protein GCM10010246_10410 [Streptomyces cuspidosporus]|uniref:Uncharacterized protein n=1 Tax=Streptomyces cuspidosporus TaxID=66882 RepID=A0ABP5SEN5_9ACTN
MARRPPAGRRPARAEAVPRPGGARPSRTLAGPKPVPRPGGRLAAPLRPAPPGYASPSHIGLVIAAIGPGTPDAPPSFGARRTSART